MNNVGNTPPPSDWELAMNPQSAAPTKRVAAEKPAPKAPEQPKMDPFVVQLAGSSLN